MDDTLRAQVQKPSGLVVEVVTLGCPGDCVEVVAVGLGGNPPYQFTWDDGSTDPTRTLCPREATTFTARVMDTAVAAAEFSYPPQTASATVKAELLDCTAPSDAPESLVYWANWTVLRPGNDGSAEGSLTPPAGTIKIGYSGEVNAVSQTSDALFNNYIPESTYMSPSVANAPTNAGMIAVAGDPTLMQVLRFSSSIDNPLLAVWSLGFGASGTPATWEFDPAPTMLSSGPNIYSLPTSSLTVSDKQVTGVEGNGVLQFAGRLSAIAFRVPVPEMAPGFAGFTVGMRAPH